MKKLFINIIGCLIFFVNVTAQSLPVSLESLLTDSYDVVEGDVINVQAEWDNQHKFIYSFVDIHVKKSLMHNITNEVITLKELGGTIGNFLTYSDLLPYYQEGEKVIVCVGKKTDSGEYFTLGFWQGKFDIKDKAGKKVLIRNKNNREMLSINDNEIFEPEIGYEALFERFQKIKNRGNQ